MESFVQSCTDVENAIVQSCCRHSLQSVCERVRITVESELRDATRDACLQQYDTALATLTEICSLPMPEADLFIKLCEELVVFVQGVESKDGAQVDLLLGLAEEADHVGLGLILRCVSVCVCVSSCVW
jgi:hypothetical protein